MYIPFKENILSLFFFFTIAVFSIITSFLPFRCLPPPHHCHDDLKVAIIFIVTIIVSGSVLCVLIICTNLFCPQ